MTDLYIAERFWCLENIDIFKKIPKREQMELSQIAKMALYKKGDAIFLPGDPSDTIYFLRKGRVKLVHLDEGGKRLTLTICKRGEPFGEMALAGEVKRSLVAEALDEVELCIVTKSDLMKFVEKNPNFQLKINKIIGMRFIEIKNRLDDLLFKDVRTRLARLILRLGEEFGEERSDGILINIRLTHQDLADLIGSTRETTSTTLIDFETNGWIGKVGRNLTLLNPAALREIAAARP